MGNIKEGKNGGLFREKNGVERAEYKGVPIAAKFRQVASAVKIDANPLRWR